MIVKPFVSYINNVTFINTTKATMRAIVAIKYSI